MIAFISRSFPASTTLHGEETGVVVAAGKSIVIETTPGGLDICNETVPAGKVWTVSIGVNIVETDE